MGKFNGSRDNGTFDDQSLGLHRVVENGLDAALMSCELGGMLSDVVKDAYSQVFHTTNG